MYILHQFIIHIMEGYICLFFFYYVCFSCTENLLEISKQRLLVSFTLTDLFVDNVCKRVLLYYSLFFDCTFNTENWSFHIYSHQNYTDT